MKLITKASTKHNFKVGDLVRWNEYRDNETIIRTGTIIKINTCISYTGGNYSVSTNIIDVQNERGDIFRGYPEELAHIKSC